MRAATSNSSKAISRSSASSGSRPQSFDVIVSNCVINLSVDKLAVLRGAYDLLKPGGELYFADVYCDRRLSDEVRADPVLYGECLGGALYWNDFLPMAKRAGFLDPRLVTSRPIDDRERGDAGEARPGEVLLGHLSAVQARGLETACEDYGQAVIYRGTMPEQPDAFELDGHHLIETRQGVPGVRQHLAHAGRHALRAAFRFHRRLRHPLRHLPRLRHVDPVCHKLGAGSEIERRLLLARR